MVVEHGEHFRFPGRLAGPHRPRRLRVPLGVIAVGHHVQHLAQLLDRVVDAVLVNEMQWASRGWGMREEDDGFF